MKHYEKKALILIQKRAEFISNYTKELLKFGRISISDARIIKHDADDAATMADGLLKTIEEILQAETNND